MNAKKSEGYIKKEGKIYDSSGNQLATIGGTHLQFVAGPSTLEEVIGEGVPCDLYCA